MPKTKKATNGERYCPNCGELHASSLVPEGEMHHLANQGVKLSALPKADVYRVFYCGEYFYPVVHDADGNEETVEGGEEA